MNKQITITHGSIEGERKIEQFKEFLRLIDIDFSYDFAGCDENWDYTSFGFENIDEYTWLLIVQVLRLAELKWEVL